MKKLLISTLLMSTLIAPGITLAGDATIGKGKYAVCGGCHGPTGAGNPALKYPKLSGLQADYLVEQLKAFKSGARDNAVMKVMVAGLSDTDMEHVAAYIATFE